MAITGDTLEAAGELKVGLLIIRFEEPQHGAWGLILPDVQPAGGSGSCADFLYGLLRSTNVSWWNIVSFWPDKSYNVDGVDLILSVFSQRLTFI